MSSGTPVRIPRASVLTPTRPAWQWPGGLKAAYASEPGAGHARNEDCCSHAPCAERPGFCGVADGVGGGAHGDVASSVLLRHCARATKDVCRDPARLAEWVTRADGEVRDAIARRSDAPGAATLAAAWFPTDRVAHVVNVGDCRAYRLSPRNGRYAIERLTVDQTYANLGQTPPPAARPDDPARMVGAGAVGEPPVLRTRMGEGDLLLLCSDGLHKFVPDEQIATVVGDGLGAGRSLEAICGALVRAAKVNGSRDDASALLVLRRPWLARRWLYAAIAIAVVLLLVAPVALAETQSVIDPTESLEPGSPPPARAAKKAPPPVDAAAKRERQRAQEESRRRASAEARAQAAEQEAARLRAAEQARQEAAAAREARERKAAAARAAAAREARARAAAEKQRAAERDVAAREAAVRDAAARELAAREAAREAAEREAAALAAREAAAREAAAREAAAKEEAAREAAARQAAREAAREKALRFVARAPRSEPFTKSPGKSGVVFRDCAECPELIWLPQGEFVMGENARRSVRIDYALAVGRFEVTFTEWDACVAAGGCGRRPDDAGWGRGRQPVVNVSWSDAQQYVAWLSRRTGKRYRLLSEAEWEYAARAGSHVRFWWGNESGQGEANCSGCGSRWDGRRAAPVGSFAPNPFGLHDMHGNVSEWVEDCHRDTPGDAKRFDCSLITGRRLVRGGGWRDAPQATSAAARAAASVTYSDNRIGLRVARTD